MAIWLEEQQPLQTALVVEGHEIPINTSFRVWLKFQRTMAETHIANPIVLACEPPEGIDWREAAIAFCADRQETPKPRQRPNDVRISDIGIDAYMIVAAFQQAYGIDLTDPKLDMHWHRFLALFRCLPQETMMSHVFGWRSWRVEDEKRKSDDQKRELREAYALPLEGAESDEELLALQASWFDGIEYKGGDN